METGVTSLIRLKKAATIPTILLDNTEEPNRSLPSSCRLRLTWVLMTERAFLEIQSVISIITPAVSKRKVFVCIFCCKASMVIFIGSELAAAILYASMPARGTPIKFTRSFAAKAMAREKVPARTIGFNMLIRVKSVRNWKIRPKNTQLPARMVQEL